MPSSNQRSARAKATSVIPGRARLRRARWATAAAAAVLAALLVPPQATAAVPAPSAHSLDGVFHAPYGIDDLYSREPTERSPRDPMAGDEVVLDVTTWPVAENQSVWVTWTVNGVDQVPVGASWDHNDGDNSYWRVALGAFERGDVVEYTVHADVDGGSDLSTEPFAFTTTSWSTVTDVLGFEDHGTSVDVLTGDTAGDFSPRVRFAFPRDGGFDVQVSPTGDGLDLTGSSGYTVEDRADELRISTGTVVLALTKQPYRLSVYEADGATLITRQYDPALHRTIAWASDGSSVVTRIEDHLLTPEGERFEGFGQRYDQLDQRGQDVHNYVYNQYMDQGNARRTYLSVPFFTSSVGYGIHVPSSRYSVFTVATQRDDMIGFTVDTEHALDATLTYEVYTGTPSEIVEDYTTATAAAPLPPRWAFGVWMSANEWNTQSEVEEQLAAVREHEIPHSVLVLEQWSDEATFYLWHGATYAPTDGSVPLGYDDLSFPAGGAWTDPRGMVDAAHDDGVKVILWQIPVLKENFDSNPAQAPQQHLNDTAHAEREGYVVETERGDPYRVPSGQWFGDSTVPDFTDVAASAWWASKRAYLLDEVHVDGFKTDGGEAIFGRSTTFGDGRLGDEMHNAYPGAYTGAYREVLDAAGDDRVLFSRAGTSGAQATSIYWAGDQASTFEAFREAMRAGQSAGQSGAPFWAWDMAGFTGDFPTAELYLRAAAQSVFSPVMQYHSEKSDPQVPEARTPWNVAERTGDATVVPTFRTLANVRMNLVPYVYTAAERASRTGEPLMRSMSLAFPADADAARYDQQYMFGDALLVAPVTEEGATRKTLYLPAGTWTDLWSGVQHAGGAEIVVDVPVGSIPVLVREGAVIPMNLGAGYELGSGVGNDVERIENLTFRVEPSAWSSSDYYDQEEVLRRVSVSTDESGEVRILAPALLTESTYDVRTGSVPTEVTLDGEVLTRAASVVELGALAEGWVWDGTDGRALVKTGPSDVARSVSLAVVQGDGLRG